MIDIFADLQSNKISPNQFALILAADPYVNRSLFRWLAVVATDSNNLIAPYSNGCGLALAWCLSAPGSRIYSTDSDSNSDYATSNGTSFAAPHVSGALAVLQSSMPAAPMTAVVALLLTSATDLGDISLDTTYGWGLLNLERAIAMRSQLRLAGLNSAPQFLNAELELPPAFAHIKKRLGGIQTAVGGIGDAYFNIALGDIATIKDTEKTMDADAAADMLARPEDSHAAGRNFVCGARAQKRQGAICGRGCRRLAAAPRFLRRLQTFQMARMGRVGRRRRAGVAPFLPTTKAALFYKSAAGVGGRLRRLAARPTDRATRHGVNSACAGAAALADCRLRPRARALTKTKLFGAQILGALGAGRARTMQGKIALGGEMGGGWRGLASYQIARGRADIASGGLLNRMSGLRAEGWSAGLERRNIFGGGRLRMMLQQKTAIRRGRAVFGGAVAEGDFGRAFYGGKKQTLRRQSASVDLSAPSRPSLLVGYATSPQENFRWSLAAEHAPAADKTALSARMEMDF